MFPKDHLDKAVILPSVFLFLDMLSSGEKSGNSGINQSVTGNVGKRKKLD